MKSSLLLLVILPIATTTTTLAFTSPIQPISSITHLKSSTSETEEITIDQYSRCLSPSQQKQSIRDESNQYSIIDSRPQWQNNLLKPVKLVGKAVNKVGRAVGTTLFHSTKVFFVWNAFSFIFLCIFFFVKMLVLKIIQYFISFLSPGIHIQ